MSAPSSPEEEEWVAKLGALSWDLTLAAKTGDLKVLQTTWEAGWPDGLRTGELSEWAAEGGQLAVLQWLHKVGFPWSAETCGIAAYFGHLEVLQWLRAHGCIWNIFTSANAASSGRLDVLQWLRANGCPWTESTCQAAADIGRLDLLQWLRAQDPPCPWGTFTFSAAVKKGHWEVLQWLRSHGCPWDESVCLQAAECDHLDVLQWLMAAGCPSNPSKLIDAAYRNKRWLTLQWLLKTYPSSVVVNGAPGFEHFWQYHYEARQGLAQHHGLQWGPEILRWLSVVAEVMKYLADTHLCSDVSRLVQAYV